MKKHKDFKVGDKIRRFDWPMERYFEIMFFDKISNVFGVDQDEYGQWFASANSSEWELWQQPGKKKWLWADANGAILGSLSDVPFGDYKIKLQWSETEMS